MIYAAPAAGAGPFTVGLDQVARGFEALGAAVLVAGVLWSIALAAAAARQSRSSSTTFLVLRQSVGNTLLLALEVLVAAGLVRTVAVSPTVHNVLVLGLIVVIRTFLSFSLQTEIDGVSPWRRAAHHDETSLTTPRSRLARRQDPANDRAGERERSS